MSDKNIILILVIALIAAAAWAHYNYMHRSTVVYNVPTIHPFSPGVMPTPAPNNYNS